MCLYVRRVASWNKVQKDDTSKLFVELNAQAIQWSDAGTFPGVPGWGLLVSVKGVLLLSWTEFFGREMAQLLNNMASYNKYLNNGSLRAQSRLDIFDWRVLNNGRAWKRGIIYDVVSCSHSWNPNISSSMLRCQRRALITLRCVCVFGTVLVLRWLDS